ncbi:flagellar protein [Treponema denticola]|uniref:Flagellar filament outer layer protein n=1 Tax=Treponema denticola TaxID=158 RepID=A0A9Q9BLS6_TREDN|nr:flagellar filament outer layer protein FlaA [Treponema denticola]UTC90530.1 flagellar protein [Treponema denticola]UTD00119.1 flagellar protein [Treponema denticola]UTD04904.1 flagellar protein [Treponema denticola]
MKKTFILVAMAFLLMGAVAVAEEAIIIDFALLNADIIADPNGKMTQNRRTVLDYGKVAGASYTDEQKALMRTSLALEQWDVELNSSAQNPLSIATSTIKEAEVRAEGEKFASQRLMGVRILFPEWTNNANAKIKPGFLIPAYEKMAQVDDQGNLQEPTDEDKASGKSRFEDGYGIVRNTGVIKSIAVNTYGMNFPHGLYVLLRDQNNVVKRYFMGYLLFDGWREMIWNNPSYIANVKSRELRLYPVYPTALPHVAFEGFLITRDAAHDGGDAIAYFKDVKIIYDKAVLTTVRDFADEDIWGIQAERETKRKKIEVEKFGHTQVLRFLEQEKMATEEGFTPSEGSEKNTQ